jgi:hypothetical protein
MNALPASVRCTATRMMVWLFVLGRGPCKVDGCHNQRTSTALAHDKLFHFFGGSEVQQLMALISILRASYEYLVTLPCT